MRLNFCTLFNSNYLTRGLAMYESLVKHSRDFHLYIFAFDAKTHEIILKLNLSHTTVIPLDKFEDEALLKVKPTRTQTEYCWTCTPSVIRYSIETYHLDSCTYLDADLFFFSDPKVLIEEMGSDSVLITEHRYTQEYDISASSGKYCVQFMTFKSDERGMKVLNWWRDSCIEWCFARQEDGKNGDQKYLDDWTTRFEGIHELQHIGGGVAIWNLQQYKFTKKEDRLFLKQPDAKEFVELVFFHFQSLAFYSEGIVKLAPAYAYRIPKKVIMDIYVPYISRLMELKNEIGKIDSSFDPNGSNIEISKHRPRTWKYLFYHYKQFLFSLNFKKMLNAIKESESYHYYYLKEGPIKPGKSWIN